MKVPSDIESDNVKLLQSKLNTDCSPVYVTVSPSEESIVNKCFPNVRKQVDVYGGEEVIGWQV